VREYDLISDWYRGDRSSSIGVREALSAVASLPRGSRILDLGCGACPFLGEVFDAAVSWGMLFHLEPRDQARTFAAVSRVLKPGAPFLFTAAEIAEVPADDPGITGTMNGVTFRYFAVKDYRTLIAEHDFALERVYDDPGVSTYYYARKRS
jgi:ubiquinone/menaquinone biosynthesis C-methylase UbiE